MKSIYKYFGILFLIYATSTYMPLTFAQDGQILQTLNKAMTGIIKSAGNIGGRQVCEAALPEIFCEIVVAPVLHAIFEDAPFLKPHKDDTLEQLKQKMDFTLRLLKENQKYQEIMLDNFLEINEGQQSIISEINKLGATQNDIQQSIQAILLYQINVKESVDELLEKQSKEEMQVYNRTKNEVLSLWYKCWHLVVESEYLIKSLEIRGGPRPDLMNNALSRKGDLTKDKEYMESTSVTMEYLEKQRLFYSRYATTLEMMNKEIEKTK